MSMLYTYIQQPPPSEFQNKANKKSQIICFGVGSFILPTFGYKSILPTSSCSSSSDSPSQTTDH
ncbi:hypothetical protein DERP_005026 [Dermatophagoides pteronyssinus]|uniref:Uncharacterized protein n=1 Tax=Dermatophagoides pteronyssinus TaxID=6956 RepID=A0ABQ8JTS9_DERPT|nr:hypothetical protein DERP_005026 [Dermatophagoides pteronyssinus]